MRRDILVGLSALMALRPAAVRAACNVIPAAERTFVGTLGEVSTPFARPGDPVTVRRAADVFATPVTDNHVTVTFTVPDSAPVVVVVALVVVGSFLFPPNAKLGAYLAYVAVLCVVLVGTCWLKGEPLRWRWGNDERA